jgi:flagellar protein FlbD
MIPLTRLNRTPLFVNVDLIQHIEATPDTVVTLTSGNNFMVRETPEQIIDRIVHYRRRITQVEHMAEVVEIGGAADGQR